MRKPYSTPRLLSEKTVVLREVKAAEAMLAHLRTRPLPDLWNDTKRDGVKLRRRAGRKADLNLIRFIDQFIRDGRTLAEALPDDTEPRQGPRPKGVRAFMDVSYAVKEGFFHHLRGSEDLYRV